MWKLFCFTAFWFLNWWRLIFRTHNLFINHENILFKICKVKTYCFLRLNVHSWISLEYLPWNCRYHLLKEVVFIIVVWPLCRLNLYSIFTNSTCFSLQGQLSHQDPGEFPEEVKTLFEKAVQYYEQNMTLMVEIGDRAAQGRACGNLGNVHYLLGNFSRAIHFHQERLKIAREFGDRAAGMFI